MKAENNVLMGAVNTFGDGSTNEFGDGSANELYWEPGDGLTALRGSGDGYGFNLGLCFDDSRW